MTHCLLKCFLFVHDYWWSSKLLGDHYGLLTLVTVRNVLNWKEQKKMDTIKFTRENPWHHVSSTSFPFNMPITVNRFHKDGIGQTRERSCLFKIVKIHGLKRITKNIYSIIYQVDQCLTLWSRSWFISAIIKTLKTMLSVRHYRETDI